MNRITRIALAAVTLGASVLLSAGPAGPVSATETDPCSWPAVKRNDEVCGTYSFEPVCGGVTGTADFTVTNKPTWTYVARFSETAPADFEDGTEGGLTFPEDYNGGSVTVYAWIGGTENDVVNGRGLPTYDDGPETLTIDTDCAAPVTEPTTTAPAAPVPVATVEVVCTSTGPDYVAWQITNTGEVAVTSPVALDPGASAVLESFASEEGSVTVEVGFADGSTGTFTGSGDGCTFTAPPTSAAPDTTAAPVTTTVAPAAPAAPTADPSGELPATGGETTLLAALAGLLVLSGAGTLTVARVRRR